MQDQAPKAQANAERDSFGSALRALLSPLAKRASQMQGYDVLCAMLGEDPLTGESAPRDPKIVIGRLLQLVGQEELWQNIERANAVDRAAAWFERSSKGLTATARMLPSRLAEMLRSLGFADLLSISRAFERIAGVFTGFYAELFRFAFSAAGELAEIVISAVAPNLMPYLRKAGEALGTILRDPVGFVRNLVRAGVQGLEQFGAKFLSHLRASLLGWLTGALAGANIHVPQDFSPKELLKLVLSVLGLTWQNVRSKLVKATSERLVSALETGFDLVVTLVREGPAAAWEKIVETLGNLRDMVLARIMAFVEEKIVKVALARLVAMLNPAGAVIQAIIAIYDTVMFFVERLRQIAEVAAAFIDSLAAIAAGDVAAAANRVEGTLGGALTLVISFLARLVGLGRVGEVVADVVNRARQPVDRALDRAVEWIVEMARKAGRFVADKARAAVEWWRARQKFKAADGEHTLYFEGEGAAAQPFVQSERTPLRDYIEKEVIPSLRTATGSKADERKKILNQIMESIARVEEIKTRTNGQFGQTDGGEIGDHYANIAKWLQELNKGLGAVETVLLKEDSTTLSDGSVVGRHMHVKPLTLSPGKLRGSKPYEKPTIWSAISRRKDQYVLGHLLNHHLHGAGKETNLVPITKSLNTTMSVQVEEKVKEAVFRQGKIVDYEVEFIFGPHPKESAEERKIEQELELPTAVSITASEIKATEGGGWKTVGDIAKPFNKTHELPKNSTPVDFVPLLYRISINNPQGKGTNDPDVETTLRHLYGIDDKRVALLLQHKDNGRFKSIEDVEKAVNYSGLVEKWTSQKNQVDGQPLVYLNGKTIWKYPRTK